MNFYKHQVIQKYPNAAFYKRWWEQKMRKRKKSKPNVISRMYSVSPLDLWANMHEKFNKEHKDF